MKSWKPTRRQLAVMEETCKHLVSGHERNCTNLWQAVLLGRKVVVSYAGSPILFAGCGFIQWLGYMHRLSKRGVFVERRKGKQTMWRLGPIYDQLVEEGVL